LFSSALRMVRLAYFVTWPAIGARPRRVCPGPRLNRDRDL